MKDFLQEHKSWIVMAAIVLLLSLAIHIVSVNRVNMEMHATVINTKTGKTGSTTTLTVKGWKPNQEGKFKGLFQFDDDFQYSLFYCDEYNFIQFLYNHGAPIGIQHIQLYLYDTGLNTSTFANMSVDFENACMIILLVEQPGCYIVAAEDPNMSPEDILAHFETSITFWENLYNSSPDQPALTNPIDFRMFAYSIGENTGLQFQTTLSIVGEKPVLNDNASGEFAVQMEFGKNPN